MADFSRLTTFEIGEKYGVTPQALWFYEEQGLLAPESEGGVRYFSAKDCVKIELIIKGRRLGFSFFELKLIILALIGQRAAYDAARRAADDAVSVVGAPDLAEKIWQFEKQIEALRDKVKQLQSKLLGDTEDLPKTRD